MRKKDVTRQKMRFERDNLLTPTTRAPPARHLAGSIGHLEADDRLALLKQWAPARGGARAFERVEEETAPDPETPEVA